MSRAGARAAKDRRARAEMAALAARAQAWLDTNQDEGPVCDFCAHVVGTGGHTWVTDAPLKGVLSAIDEDGGAGTIEMGYSEGWLACDACDAAIGGGTPETLAAYVFEHSDDMRVGVPRDWIEANRAMILEDFAELYRAFYSANPKRTPSS